MASALNHRYPAVQGEFETELELEDEWEGEDEDEFEAEDEFEDEAFLGALGGLAKGIGGLLGDGEAEDEFEFEFEAEAEAENEAEDEDEDESEAFVNPVRRIYRDAELMAHLSRRAADAESEEESEAFLGALIPIAAQLIPRAAGLVTRNAPALIRGTTTIARRLRQNPATRQLIQALPVVLQRTAQSLADQSAAGVPVTPQTAVQTLASMTQRLFGSPDGCRSALRAVSVFDRRYQRRARRARALYRNAGATAGGPAYTRASRAASPRPRRRHPSSPAPRRARRPR